jgi:hypothetical protein
VVLEVAVVVSEVVVVVLEVATKTFIILVLEVDGMRKKP